MSSVSLVINHNSKSVRISSLGLLSSLGDALILEILELLTEKDLVKLSLVSRFCFMLSQYERLWKKLCIQKRVHKKIGDFDFKGSWKWTTLLAKDKTVDKLLLQPRFLQGFQSKKIQAEWYRSHVLMSEFNITDTGVERRTDLTLEEFILNYEMKNKPVILSGNVIKNWNASKKWKLDNLLKVHGETLFKTNGTDDEGRSFKMTLKNYVEYMKYNTDEKPIYLFDNKFFERAPDLLSDFEIPIYFREDLFDLLDIEDRPDWRWILVGPSRSGSPLHQDPHRTSAWNALIQGRKRWALYPPDVIPPGVDEELIDTEYYAATDVMKWYTEVYPKLNSQQKPIECILEEGEIIFVPSGWWHSVLNLTDTVAVTQNFCSERTFPLVFADLVRRKRKNRGLLRDFTKAMMKNKTQLMHKHNFDSQRDIEDYLNSDNSSSDSD